MFTLQKENKFLFEKINNNEKSYAPIPATQNENPPPLVKVVDVASRYGIRPGLDNTAALMRLNSEWKANKNLVKFIFPEGEINYLDNSWLAGIPFFEIVGHNTIFRCLAGSEQDIDKFPFLSTGIFITKNPHNDFADNSGQLFKSAIKGSTSILVTNSANYKAGNKVYLFGFAEQFNGIPVNPRFFEWKEVRAVDGNRVTFTEPLKWSYNENWKDIDIYQFGLYGKPRITKLTNYCSYAKFSGCIMAKGPYARNDVPNAFFFKSDILILDSCTIEGDVWTTENRVAIIMNSRMNGTEPDKNCYYVTYNNCDIGSINAATGVDSLVIKNCRIKSSCIISPRILYAEGNTFNSDGTPNLYPHNEGTFIEKVYLKNNTFSGGDPGLAHTTFWYSRKTFTPIGILEDGLVVNDELAVKGIYQGAFINSKKSSALVKDIIPSGENFLLQLTNIKGDLKISEDWTYNGENKVVDLGGNKSLNNRKIY